MTARSSGFTILELVLSMTALALLAAICYGAFHLGLRAVERGEVAVVTGQRLRAATDVIVRQVRSAWGDGGCDEREAVVHFEGTATALAFATTAGLASGGRPAWVKYFVTPDPSETCTVPPCLVMEEYPMGTEDGPALAVSLIEGFRDFRFRYDPGAEECEDEEGGLTDEAWCTTWSGASMTVLPRAVEFRIEGAPGAEVWERQIPILLARMSDVDSEGVGLAFEDEERYGCDRQADASGSGGSGSDGSGGTGSSGSGSDDDDEEDVDSEDEP